jgi:hypothetical protein
VRRLIAMALAVAGIGALAVFLVGAATAGSGNKAGVLAGAGSARNALLKRAATGELKRPTIPITVTRNGTKTTIARPVPFISGAAIAAEQQAICPGGRVPNCAERAQGADAGSSGNIGLDNTSIGSHTLGCGQRNPFENQRVNQDCTYRRQAEEDITYSVSDPNNLVAGQNDSRVGFNQCGIDFSTNGGGAWGDMLPPFRQHLNDPQDSAPNTINGDPGTFHTYDAASDPVNATDSRGRAFFSCVTFDVASNASGLFVTESPLGAKGSFYYNVPMIGRNFIAVEDNSPFVLHDKNWIAADHYASSPNRDNIYVTWTVFKFGTTCLGGTDTAPAFCESPIYGSMSTDHGHTWSAPEQISGQSPTLCFFGNHFSSSLPADDCNNDQGSNPVVLPNGDLEVAYNNGNTAQGNPNAQQLAVHCRPTGDSVAGTAHFNCAAPVKVGDDVTVGQPQCDFGRGPEECIPGAYIRTNDFPRILTENTQNNHLDVVWQDYRNGAFDIHMSQSLDGGLTWSDAGQVNPDSGLDHYFPAVDQSPQHGGRLGVSYYRTQRVTGENTTPAGGFAPCGANGVVNMGASTTCQPGVGAKNSDYVLAGGTGDHTPYAFDVLSPVFPPPDGIQSGFNGDYSGITINRGNQAHPIWSDTRSVNPFPANGVNHDEDVYSDKVSLPSGGGEVGPGRIGKR